MELVAGEYEFTCAECDGDGNLQYIRITTEGDGEPELVWDKCDDCRGQGTVLVDEEEAAEKIECGQTPIRAPAAN